MLIKQNENPSAYHHLTSSSSCSIETAMLWNKATVLPWDSWVTNAKTRPEANPSYPSLAFITSTYSLEEGWCKPKWLVEMVDHWVFKLPAPQPILIYTYEYKPSSEDDPMFACARGISESAVAQGQLVVRHVLARGTTGLAVLPKSSGCSAPSS